jgi:ATP sulfurylase
MVLIRIISVIRFIKTTELEHPGVKMVMEQGDVNLAGTSKVLSPGNFKKDYGDFFNISGNALTVSIQKLEKDCRVSNT